MMKICRYAGILTAMLSVGLLAQNGSGLLGKSYLEAGLNGSFYSYSEDCNAGMMEAIGITTWSGTPKSTESGFVPMLHLAGRLYAKSAHLTGGFLVDLGRGNLTYDGSTQSEDTVTQTMVYAPVTLTSNNTFAHVGIFAGPYIAKSNYLLGAHAGFLYCDWYRSVKGDNSFASTPERYGWFYLPVGVEGAYCMTKTISVGLNIEYRIMVAGSMWADFSSLTMGTPLSAETPVLNLGKRNGFFAEMPIQVALKRHLALQIKPWFELRPSGISNIDSVRIVDNQGGEIASPMVEPGSTCSSAGLTLSIDYICKP